MFSSIKLEVIVITLVPLVVTILTIGLFAVASKRASEQDLTINRLTTYRTLLESGDLSFESLNDTERLEALLNEKVRYAAILKKDGAVLYATDTRVPTERDEIVIPLIDEAFEGVETTNTIDEDSETLLVFVTPLVVGENIVAVLRIDLAGEQTAARIRQFNFLMLGIGVISLLICYFLITVLFSQTILRGIYKLKEATTLIENGDLSTPVKHESDDELGELANSLDAMRTEILNTHTKLQVANKDLEKQVQDRTAALEQNLQKLERLNSFMVDREVKMIALKNKIARLEKK